MKTYDDPLKIGRREFVRLAAVGTAVAALASEEMLSQEKPKPAKPATNIQDALKVPRNEKSLPGKYPGTVIQAYDDKSIANNKIDLPVVDAMVRKSLLTLTGASSIAKAWNQFVTPEDIIGLKVNPVAGKDLSTSLEIVHAIVKQLEESGIPKKNIVIWDRREFEMHEVGFTKENFPGVQIIGTERKDEKGSFYNAEGKLYGADMIDEKWSYWADLEQKYDAETLPYMINEGKHSYFGKICTQQVTKIINIPILKNAGPTVTLCLKNLAYGCISNTGRLHRSWHETCAEVPCFEPVRDKVVLNIVDGIKGCYDKGPGADPKFFTEYKTVLVGTDPVAVDRIGHEIVVKKRIDEKLQKEDVPGRRLFLDLAKNYGLGESDISKIQLQKV
ncbi:MAG: DUF362 domain-containing protein [bacterium]